MTLPLDSNTLSQRTISPLGRTAENPQRGQGGASGRSESIDTYLSFEKCVGAIVRTMVGQEAPAEASDANVETVSAFLMATHSKMPDYLQLAFHILVLAFDAWPCLTKGKPFHRLDVKQRSGQLDRWEHSHIGAKRSLVAFYRSLVTFGLFSELHSKQDFRADTYVKQG